jgi:hypothetical protein
MTEFAGRTAMSCRPVLEAEDGLAGWRYRIPPGTAIAGRAPSAGGGQILAGAGGRRRGRWRRSVAG